MPFVCRRRLRFARQSIRDVQVFLAGIAKCVEGSENDYNSQFGVYEQDHASAESTSFDQGHHVEYSNPSGAHYEESDFTSYDHSAAEADHVFAAEGSESSHQAEFSNLDALRQQFDTAFASGTEFHGGAGALGVASN